MSDSRLARPQYRSRWTGRTKRDSACRKRDWYPVSSAQQRMYALHHIEKNGTGYNMPSVLMLEGVLDTDRLRRAFADLVNRHESLRTAFVEIDGRTVQIVHEKRTLT
ncbi:condensation domain-containing protein [Bacillus licheniformis]|nr:condensation domain-containing protein [Bacillus licheniformis]